MQVVIQIKALVVLALVAALGVRALAPAAPSPRALDPVLDADPFNAMGLASLPPMDATLALKSYLLGVFAASIGGDGHLQLQAAYDDPHVTPDIARRALSVAGVAALRQGDYARAADLFERELQQYGSAMDERSRVAEQQNRDVAAALRAEPAQTLEGWAEATIPLTVNALGLTTAPCEIEGQVQAAVIDTGANLSVLSESAARALGVRTLDSKVSVRSATNNEIASRLAVADTVRLGPVSLHHVVFIVLDDEALSPLGPKHRVDAIIGFPVLAALGRIAFRDAAPGGEPARRSMTLLPPLAHPQLGNLRFAGLSVYVRTDAGPFLVDSGADKTSFEKLYGHTFPQRLQGLERRTIKVGGAGGSEERHVAIVPKLSLGIGTAQVELTNVRIHLNGNGTDTAYGTLGADVLWAKGGYTIDFKPGDLVLGAP